MRVVVLRERLAEEGGVPGFFDEDGGGSWTRLRGEAITDDDWMGIALKLEGPFAKLAQLKFDCRRGDVPVDVPDDPSFLLLP